MKKIFFSILVLIIVTGSTFYFSGCVKQEFDTPPIHNVPIGEILTIGDIRQIYQDSGVYVFTADYSLYATITMDESSGNIYKSAYIQDNSGAVNLHFLESGGVTVGDSIRVYLKDCIISTYNELLQIDNIQNDSNIIILANKRYVEPQLLTIADVNTGNYESQLIRLDSVQFLDGELGKTYADAEASANRGLEDCDGESILVRTSNYSNFAFDPLPGGKGSLIAIAGVFGTTQQLYIRTLDEVNLDGTRCDGGGTPVDPVDEINEDFETASPDVDIMLEGWLNIIEAGDRKWQGKDYSGNTYAQSSGYQSGLDEMICWLITPPINVQGTKILKFLSAKAYWEHQSDEPLEVLASTDFDGTNIETATWTKLNPYIAGQSDTDNEWYESGDVDISSFSGVCYIAFKYSGSDTESTSLRLDDIKVNSSGGGGQGVTSIEEDFESQTNDEDINIQGWFNIATEGSRLWRAKEYDDEVYAQATSYGSDEENVCWMITPAIDLNDMTNPQFSFETAQAYWTHDGLTVYISTDFNGVSVEGATWTELNCIIANESDPAHEWIDSGIIDLSAYSGMGYIGFKYMGNGITGLTSSYRVDNVLLEEAK